MNQLILQLFQVGNGDCILISLPEHDVVGAIDFCESDLIPDHPLNPFNKNVLFLPAFGCLTHPHYDHIGKVDKTNEYLKTIAQNGGEFWHTIPQIDEVIQLYYDALIEHPNWYLCEELRRIAFLYNAVAKEFPKDKIKRIHSNSNLSSAFEKYGIQLQVLAPYADDLKKYMDSLVDVKKKISLQVESKLINNTSAIILISIGDKKCILGGDASGQVWQRIINDWKNSNSSYHNINIIKASHHGSSDSFYDGMWDDLFGSKSGIVLISANGYSKPSKKFIASFSNRRQNKIFDEIKCTGGFSTIGIPDFQDEYQELFSRVAVIPNNSSIGKITVSIPEYGNISVNQS